MRMMKYKVIKEYNDAPQFPITIKKGENLRFIDESDPAGFWPNWILCRGKDKEGWIPKQILKIEGSEVISSEDYTAREHNLVNDEVLVAEKELNGWIWGWKVLDPGIWAWAPLNHLQKLF